MAQAQEAIDQQDPAAAIPVLDTVLADDPDNPPAQRLLEAALEDARSAPGAPAEPPPQSDRKAEFRESTDSGVSLSAIEAELERARRIRIASLEQRLEALDHGVNLGRGGWPEIVEALVEIESLDPQGALVAKRLPVARALGDLEERLRGLYKEGNWTSVIQIGSEMGRLHSRSGDPNGLVTSACVRLSNSMRESAREPMATAGQKGPLSQPPPIQPMKGPLKSSGVLTADAARTVSFETTVFRHGYSKYEVRDYLDLVVETLTALETGRFKTGPLLEADDVLKARFQTTKMREGFDKDEVDDFLDSVIRSLRAYRDAGRYPPP
jgi:DivIVA domain-containing protein